MFSMSTLAFLGRPEDFCPPPLLLLTTTPPSPSRKKLAPFRAGKLLRIMIRFSAKRLQFLRCQVPNISVFESSNNQAVCQAMLNQSVLNDAINNAMMDKGFPADEFYKELKVQPLPPAPGIVADAARTRS